MVVSLDFFCFWTGKLIKNHNHNQEIDMESAAYILVLALSLGVLFFAIAFREPPRIGK